MNNSAAQTWVFQALDTLFFRESRPMDSIGNAELSSLFPPSARTMIGAIRSVLGESRGVDWQAYRQKKQEHALAQIMGYGDELGPLQFGGVWLHKNGERLYPAPLNIMRQKKQGEEKDRLFFMTIGDEPVHTDLGRIRLPLLQKGEIGSKPLENIWLPESEFIKILCGEMPDLARCVSLLPQSVIPANGGHLLVEEARVGIARDNSQRTAIKGQLYQTRHIRLAKDVSLCMDVTGLSNEHKPDNNYLTRLGGEGRLASIRIEATPDFIKCPKSADHAAGIALYLLTPLVIENPAESWQPLPGFTLAEKDGQTVWQGTLDGIPLTLHTAITGKAQREGGWDLQKHQPRPVKSYIPAGSVFYCTGESDLKTIIEKLHGLQIGEEQKLGRGKIAAGLWRQ